jgi:hypothetical protein
MTQMDIPAEREGQVDDFFRRKQFASLLSIQGVLCMRRLRLVKGGWPRHMVVCEVERPEVIESEAYKEATSRLGKEMESSYYTAQPRTVYREIIGFRRAQYEQMSSKYLLVVQMDIPPEFESEFNNWYDNEHVPLLMMVPGWLASRRFSRIQGDSPMYMTMYELESPSAIDREEHEKTHTTEGYRRIRPHFMNFSSLLYEQLYGLSRY